MTTIVTRQEKGSSLSWVEADANFTNLNTNKLEIVDANNIYQTINNLNAPTGSNLVGFIQSGTGAVKQAVEDVLRERISVKSYGAIGDGVHDDTMALLNAHTYANSIGAPVSYQGLARFAVQADAQIPVSTSVDFSDAEMVIIGGVESPPTWGTAYNTVFIVTDDECPLQTYTGAAGGSLVKGSYTPTSGIFDGHGYAKVTCGLQIPDRDKTGTQNYVQSFKVNRFGRASRPLSVDISAYAASLTVDYRRTSKNRLTLERLAITEGAWNKQQVFSIQRCNVRINNFTLLFTGADGTFNNVCRLISIEHASDIWIDRFVTTGRPVTTTLGSYCLSINGGADIYVDGMSAITGWSAMGNNDVNGLHVTRSVVNRVEAHSGCHNVFVDDCDLHNLGVGFGWGGGVVSVTNSRTHECAAIAPGSSGWGGSFFGHMIVRNVQATWRQTASYTFVDYAKDPPGASTPVTLPETIEISDCTYIGDSFSFYVQVIPLALKVRDAASVVYAPTSISISNITAIGSWRFGLKVDFLNLERKDEFSFFTLNVRDCQADTASTTGSGQGIVGYASIRTPTNPLQPIVKIADCGNVALSIMNAIGVDIEVKDSSVNAITVDTTAAQKARVVVDGCKFETPTAPVVGASNSTNRSTIIRNSEFAGTWDLSLVSALQGVTVRTSSAVTLPATVTTAQAFSGWQKSGVFS